MMKMMKMMKMNEECPAQPSMDSASLGQWVFGSLHVLVGHEELVHEEPVHLDVCFHDSSQ